MNTKIRALLKEAPVDPKGWTRSPADQALIAAIHEAASEAVMPVEGERMTDAELAEVRRALERYNGGAHQGHADHSYFREMSARMAVDLIELRVELRLTKKTANDMIAHAAALHAKVKALGEASEGVVGDGLFDLIVDFCAQVEKL